MTEKVDDSEFGSFLAMMATSREAEIFRRHQNGESYRAIGKTLGISQGRAHQLAQKWGRIQLWLERAILVRQGRLRGEDSESIARQLRRATGEQHFNRAWVDTCDNWWRNSLHARQRSTEIEYGYA